MNAQEYRKTLTEKQDYAFRRLLDDALRASGWYAKNSEAYQKSMDAYYKGRERHKAELDEAEARYDEARVRIQELQEQISKIQDEATKQLEADRDAVGLIIQEENQDILKQIEEERGDAKAEHAIIEQIIISQYQARLDKKNKKAVA